MNLIYIASPYSTPDDALRQWRYEAAIDAVAGMMNRGMVVYSPIVHCHPIQQRHSLPTEWTYWQRFDETMIERCDELHVLMLDGWKESVGVTAEIKIAQRLDKPVRYIEANAGNGPESSQRGITVNG